MSMPRSTCSRAIRMCPQRGTRRPARAPRPLPRPLLCSGMVGVDWDPSRRAAHSDGGLEFGHDPLPAVCKGARCPHMESVASLSSAQGQACASVAIQLPRLRSGAGRPAVPAVDFDPKLRGVFLALFVSRGSSARPSTSGHANPKAEGARGVASHARRAYAGGREDDLDTSRSPGSPSAVPPRRPAATPFAPRSPQTPPSPKSTRRPRPRATVCPPPPRPWARQTVRPRLHAAAHGQGSDRGQGSRPRLGRCVGWAAGD